MIGEILNKQKIRNGLRPRPGDPDIPGHADKGARNNKTYIYIMYGKRDIF